MTLTKWLERKQQALDINDAEFARLIGISPVMWHLYRTGKRRITLDAMHRIANRFPQDRAEIGRLALATAAQTISALSNSN